MLNGSLAYIPLTGHFNSNYFTLLTPNETSLEYSLVPGNYVVVTIALGTALHLEPDQLVSPLPWNAQVRFQKDAFDTYCFWLELQRSRAGKKEVAGGEVESRVPGKELG